MMVPVGMMIDGAIDLNMEGTGSIALHFEKKLRIVFNSLAPGRF